MREAELLLSGRGGEIANLEQEFKKKIGEKKNENFVSAGTLQSKSMKATITFPKKKDGGPAVTIEAENFRPTVRLPTTASRSMIRPPPTQISFNIPATGFSNNPE